MTRGVLLSMENERDEASDLQSAFARFQAQRQEERKAAQKRRQAAAAARGTPEFAAELRAKFIDAAKGYIGTPYAQRYHDPGTCACEDLRDEFGFTLGPGNQAYQFDTLPLRVDTLAELEPGDLIFYSGTYYKEGASAQIHDMVHVEIFLGGESTVGSRERYKRVAVYDDFRIEKSKYWKLIGYHYAKIDTWLAGTLQSCCPDHAWPRAKHAALLDGGKRSVFSAQQDDEPADCADSDAG